MKNRFRSAAPLALALCAALPLTARAEDASKCKFIEFAKLPVVMEDDRASIAVTINGKPTRLWLDSGAEMNFMSKAKAVELGLKTEALPMGSLMGGIGGTYRPEVAQVRDFYGILGTHLPNVRFVVGGNDVGNGFIGASMLGLFDSEFDLAKGAVNWFVESGCTDDNLAYWSAGMAVGQARLMRTDGQDDRRIYVEVLVNGHVLRAMVDTGAPTSVIFLHQAERAGIDMKSPQVLASVKLGGVGSERRQSWIARMGTFSIGGEEIRNSPIRVVDDSDDRLHVDMLLGVDFLMAHHVLVALGEHKMYLTYNGGPIFSVSTDRETGHTETRAENMGAAEKAPDPKTADEFAGRASGRLTRKDVAGAIADFGEAIRLAPDRADLLSDRAKAYARGKQFDLALKDLDAALTKSPTDHDFLARRARLRLIKGDKVAALADADAAAASLPKGSLDVMPLAELYERLGKADRALALLDPAIDLHRDGDTNITLVNGRAWERALANVDLDRALADSNTTIRKVGPDPALLDTRALVQLRRKDYPAAIADATAALAKQPKMAPTLFVRGLARHASGDDVGGKADILAARAIRPSIDQTYALYGLVPPGSDGTPAQPSQPDGDDKDD